MPVTTFIRDRIKEDVQQQIKDLYSFGMGCVRIGKRVGLRDDEVMKFLIQDDSYIFLRDRIQGSILKLEELPTVPYSKNEMHYGSSGKGKYNYNELTQIEKVIYNKI